MADSRGPAGDAEAVEAHDDPVAARPESDRALVLVASGDGPAGAWSYWWPAADWAELDQAERRRVRRRARKMYQGGGG